MHLHTDLHWCACAQKHAQTVTQTVSHSVLAHSLSQGCSPARTLCVCLGLPVCVTLGRGRWGQDVVIGGYFLLHTMSDPLHKLLVWWPKLLLSAISVFHTLRHLSAYNPKWLFLNNTFCAFHTHDHVLDHHWSSSVCTNWLSRALPSTNANDYRQRQIWNLNSNEITSTCVPVIGSSVITASTKEGHG